MTDPDRLAYTIVERTLRPLFMRVYRVRIIGGENVPPAGACVLAANHDSIMDGFFLAISTRRQVRFMAKNELYKVPGIREILSGAGCFPVDRNGDRGRAVAKGVEVLERGGVVGIFPEGTCLPDKKVGYRRGAARLALAAGAPLVPVALIDTEKTLEPYTHKIGFPRVRIAVGVPIPVERQEPTEEAASALTERLEAEIAALAASTAARPSRR